MRTVSLEIVPYALPFRSPYVTARGRLDRREMVLVRHRVQDGRTGLGEAVPLSLRGGESLGTVVAELRALGSFLMEAGEWSPADLDGPVDRASRRLSPPAACAFATTLLDLEAKEHDMPAWRLLGAAVVEPVTCNATLSLGAPDPVAVEAERWAADGFRTFKLKLSGEDDVAIVRAVRNAVGDKAKIRLDANGAWSVREARRHLAELEPLRIELAEQPVATLRRLKRVRRHTAIPIAADESVASWSDAEEAGRLEACDMATVKLSKTGGHPGALEIAARIRTYLSSALDGPVGIAAAAATAQALRHRRLDASVAHGLATQRLFSETIAKHECWLQGDQLHLPDGPGLGVEIDDAALERHRL
jgi:o-succinylbenzoate synthase